MIRIFAKLGTGVIGLIGTQDTIPLELEAYDMRFTLWSAGEKYAYFVPKVSNA